MLDSDLCILHALDAFDDNLTLPMSPQPLYVIPADRAIDISRQRSSEPATDPIVRGACTAHRRANDSINLDSLICLSLA